MRFAGLGVAALILALAPAATAQDLPAAHAFVAKLYAAYHGDGPDYLGGQAKAVFSPSLLRLLRRDRAATPAGEVGALDGDPICDCQDFGISKVEVTVEAVGAGRARATAHFLNFTEWQTIRLDLVAFQGHWRVNDIHSLDMPSLAAFLKRSLAKSH